MTSLRLPDAGPAYQAMHAMLQRRRTELQRSSSSLLGGDSLGPPTMSLPPSAVAAETLLPALSA